MNIKKVLNFKEHYQSFFHQLNLLILKIYPVFIGFPVFYI